MPATDSFEGKIDLVRSLFDAVTRHDLDAGLALTTEDVSLKSLMGQVEGGVYGGHDGMREWYRDVVETFDPFVISITGVEDAEGRLVIGGHAQGKTAASRVDIEWDFAALAEVHDGKFSRFAIYRDRRELAAAEGLPA